MSYLGPDREAVERSEIALHRTAALTVAAKRHAGRPDLAALHVVAGLMEELGAYGNGARSRRATADAFRWLADELGAVADQLAPRPFPASLDVQPDDGMPF